MARWRSHLIDWLCQPEYTGTDRCLPCTAVNVLLAAVLTLGIAVLLDGSLSSQLLAMVVSTVSLAFLGVIFLRGYLVPGTPAFAEAVFPVWLLRWFEDQQPVNGSRLAGEFDVETALRTIGAVTECADVDDLCLTEEFREWWEARMPDLRADEPSRAALASILGVVGDSLVFEEHGEAIVVSRDAAQVGKWESKAALVADVAAQELRHRSPEWTALDIRQRSRVLQRLRIFLDHCPLCGGPVSVDREVTESCCRSLDVLAMSCEGCDARVLEAEQRDI